MNHFHTLIFLLFLFWGTIRTQYVAMTSTNCQRKIEKTMSIIDILGRNTVSNTVTSVRLPLRKTLRCLKFGFKSPIFRLNRWNWNVFPISPRENNKNNNYLIESRQSGHAKLITIFVNILTTLHCRPRQSHTGTGGAVSFETVKCSK